MTAAAVGTPARASGAGRLRRYPPLLVMVLAVALTVYTLPSALNLPQANPGQVAEYAPVPGAGAAPPGGNLAGLGLGEGAAGNGGAGSSQLSGSPGSGIGTTYQCVGNPPRQTEDPMSPPCVPVFQGDNGGSTYSGVTGSEITVVFRWEGPFTYGGDSQSNVNRPPTGYYDMNNPNDVNQFFLFRYLRDWEVYFNSRYQTYHRKAHFWAYEHNYAAGTQSYQPAEAGQDAADNWSRLHPFAALDEIGAYSSGYTSYLAQHGVVNFGGLGFTQALASQFPGLYWSFPPSLDRQAQVYASYVCSRVVAPGRVTFSGNGDYGQPRRYGLLLSDDPNNTLILEQQKLALRYLDQDCGLSTKTAADVEYFHYAGCDCTGPRSGWGVANMAAMQSKGVTTIIWPGGDEQEDPNAASRLRWYPEWVLMGDDILDGNEGVTGYGGAGSEPADEFSHAWIVTRQPVINAAGYPAERACYNALLEVDPSIPRSPAYSDIDYACGFYDDIRQLFTGIQLAGPHLTPTSMDEGFRAIPAKNSTSPDQVACFYLPGDYTCVKDAAAMWWDPNAQRDAADTGCWRMWANGARFLPGHWPSGDVTQGKDPKDICNLYNGEGITIDPTGST